MIRRNERARGTTLVEVGVVVAVFGLLVALFAPTLPGVREQARIAKCSQNLRAITQAASGYIAENETMVFAHRFPSVEGGYWIDGVLQDFNLWTEFIWGGGVPDKTQTEWDESWGLNPCAYRTDTYVITPAHRPLNAYMSPGVWWSDPERVKGNPARYLRPMLLPDYFQCPSDSSAHLSMTGVEDPNLPEADEPWFPTWKWWGTSYPINWYWAFYYAEGNSGPFFTMLLEMGPTLLEQKAERGASEFALFHENRLDYAFEGAIPRGYPGSGEELGSLRGWHGERDVHAAGFLDGSARYQYFDTRYVDGPGWTTWPNRPWEGTVWEPYQGN